MLNRRRRVFVAAAVALVLAFFGSKTAAQGPATLFTVPSVAALQTAIAPRAGVLRSRALVASLPALQVATTAGLAGDRDALLTLNLFDDVALAATFERAETDGFGHQTWGGRVLGDPLSTVTLTWRGDVLSGGVQTGSALYGLTTRNGLTIVEQIDPGSFPAELPPVLLPDADALLRGAAPATAQADGEVVDIYVYYTAAARANQGGQAQIEALIAQGIADSNTAYTRSGIQASLRLVGTSELAGFVETADMTDDLYAFRDSAAAQNTRNVFAADLMHLVLGGTSSACGVAFLGPANANSGYGVSARTCFFQYTFTHEVGHNFGNHHAPEDGAFDAWKTYAYGYKNCAAGFRTVLAYACNPAQAVTRILSLSNPNVTHNGLPTGTAATQNNALAASQAFPIVQNHRTRAAAVPSAPPNLQATVVGNHLTLTWATPASGTPIASYTLQAGTGPGLSNLFSGALGPLTAVSGPVPNGTYYLRVVAQNSAGFGPPTPDVVAVVGPAAPSAPTNLSANVAGSLLSLSWTPPSSGGSVSTYILQAGSGPGLTNLFNGALGAITSIAGNVPPGGYYLRMLAQGPGGTSPPSNEVLASVACPIPSAPVLSGSKAGTVINLSWTTPGGGAVTGYTLRVGTGSGASNLFDGAVGATNALSGPVPNGVHFIRVSATSACGESAASNEIAITIP